MKIRGDLFKKQISIAVTTYGTQSLYTHACLESIRKWKNTRHELIVACHDPSLLLEYYLESCKKDGLIDKLIYTPNNYGHTKGVNKCFAEASGDILVNIANDILIGPVIIDDCAYKLLHNKQLGLIGWHWYNDGTFWNNNNIIKYSLRDENKPFLNETDKTNIQNAKWFTGKLFNSIGPKWLQLCNTAFFVIKKSTWNIVGGFSDIYHHYWADDFLNYAVLDQGLDVHSFESKFKHKSYFHEFQYDHIEIHDRRRNDDHVPIPSEIEHYTSSVLGGGLSEKERNLLYIIAKTIESNKTILHVGLWRGAGLALFMSAMKNVPTNFVGIDCFDMANISNFSGQPPVKEEEVWRYLENFLSNDQSLELIRANTLEMNEFPKADVIFVDAGHTKECIINDTKLSINALNNHGTLIFHDYGQSLWPDIKITLDKIFGHKIKYFDTLAIIKP